MSETPVRTPKHMVLHCRVTDRPSTALDLLALHLPLSRGQLKQVMSKGAVWHGRGRQVQRIRRGKKKLQPDDRVHLYYDAKVLQEEPPAPALLADEKDYSVWFKPYGMRSQGSKWGDHCSLSRWVEQHLQRPAFIVHRLDRSATGLMMLAHSKAMAARLSRLFAQRDIAKEYRVIVHGHYDTGNDEQVLDSPIDGRPAITRVRCLAFDAVKNISLLGVVIETGRKHQIRRHLSGQGYPVVGDRMYGQDDGKNDLQLCACRLTFECPRSHERKTFELDEARLPHLENVQL